MKSFEPNAYVLLRVVAGFMFFWHGYQKLFDWPPVGHATDAWITYIGGGIELVGGALITIGLFTRPAAFLASGMMAAGYWMMHGLEAPLPIQNRGEMAALYCFVFLFIFARGGGKLSLDKGK